MRPLSRRDLSRVFELCSPNSTQIPFLSSRIRTLLLLLFFNKTKFQIPKKKKKPSCSRFLVTLHQIVSFSLLLFLISLLFSNKTKFQQKKKENPICLPYFHPFLISVIFNFIAASLLFRFPTYSPLIPTIPLLFLVLVSFSKPNSKKQRKKKERLPPVVCLQLLFTFPTS